MREQRKLDLERHVTEVKTLMRRANGEDVVSESESASEEEFEGFPDPVIEEVDREEEYIDEDKYTTVTVEAVGISKDGFEKAGKVENRDGDREGKEHEGEGSKEKKRVWTVERPKTKKTGFKKKKFRYESPAERKAARAKVSAKKKKAAEARKGK